MRACAKCGEIKSEESFRFHSKNSAGKTYRKNTCEDCSRAYDRDAKRRQKYGVSPSEFQSMIDSQDAKCAICATGNPGGTGAWCIDHDHSCCPGKKSCGKCVRALLCADCNKGIGLLRDDVDIIMAAAAYVLQRTNVLEMNNV